MSDGIIICVDDEKIILHGLETQLDRSFGEHYSLIMCESGEEALEIIQESLDKGAELLVVITDQVMPGMKGDQLLAEVHQLSPNTCNILLTGQADADAIAASVNNANLYRYITKPWEGTDLVLTVQEAIFKYNQKKLVQEQKSKLKAQSSDLELKISERTHDLQIEREKSDSLLLNILPKSVAEELKMKGAVHPKSFVSASILCTDFQGFTKAASLLNPNQLLEDLNECFTAFDEISEKYTMEKIKTIGDAYLCVGGIPSPNDSHPNDAVKAALAINNWVSDWNKQRTAAGKPTWNIRIGVHTGELIAGVIGKNKFQYDIWGESVNIAARMEKYCEIGEINISEDTYNLVKNDFDCSFREKVELKVHGKIGMYSVSGAK
jgi:adenylate cyclase